MYVTNTTTKKANQRYTQQKSDQSYGGVGRPWAYLLQWALQNYKYLQSNYLQEGLED